MSTPDGSTTTGGAVVPVELGVVGIELVALGAKAGVEEAGERSCEILDAGFGASDTPAGETSDTF